MDLSTVEIPRTGAREAAADYRREAKRVNDERVRAELNEIARAYELAAKDDLSLISLTRTLLAGGTIQRTLVENKWNQETKRTEETRVEYALPRIAVLRSDARFAYTLGVQRDGSVQFIDTLNPHWNYERGRLHVDAGFDLPDGFGAGHQINQWQTAAFCSMVPIVPPKHRPARSRTLASYLTLWEADDWAWRTNPEPPRDPALLQHVGGDIYAVLATWDLTELERLVLAGRRPS